MSIVRQRLKRNIMVDSIHAQRKILKIIILNKRIIISRLQTTRIWFALINIITLIYIFRVPGTILQGRKIILIWMKHRVFCLYVCRALRRGHSSSKMISICRMWSFYVCFWEFRSLWPPHDRIGYSCRTAIRWIGQNQGQDTYSCRVVFEHSSSTHVDMERVFAQAI